MSLPDWDPSSLPFPHPTTAPQTVTVAELSTLLTTKKTGEDYVVVDVRREDLKGGMVPTAINLPAQSFYHTLDGVVPLLAPRIPIVIFYCSKGTPGPTGRSHLCASWFRQRVECEAREPVKVGVLEGGIKGWEAGVDKGDGRLWKTVGG